MKYFRIILTVIILLNSSCLYSEFEGRYQSEAYAPLKGRVCDTVVRQYLSELIPHPTPECVNEIVLKRIDGDDLKLIYTYNFDYRLASVEIYNIEDSIIINDLKIEYNYIDNMLELEKYLVYSEGVWKDNEIILYRYDTDGNMVSEHSYLMYDGDWKDNWRYDHNFDEGLLISDIYYEYPEGVELEKFAYIHNYVNGEEKVRNYLSTIDGTRINALRWLYKYDGNSNMTINWMQEWKNENWVHVSRWEMSYIDNLLAESKYTNFIQDSWLIEREYKYSYNENRLLVEKEYLDRNYENPGTKWIKRYEYNAKNYPLYINHFAVNGTSETKAWRNNYLYEKSDSIPSGIRHEGMIGNVGYLTTDDYMLFTDPLGNIFSFYGSELIITSDAPVVSYMEKFEDKKASIYPNPCRNSFSINNDIILEGQLFSLELFCTDGTKVFQREFITPYNKIATDSLSNGNYIYIIRTKEKTITGNITIIR